MKRKILIFFLLLFLVSSFSFVLATGKELENKYPDLPGVITPTTTEEPIVLYLLYIYQLSIAASAFLIFIIFIIGGWKYLFSVGNPVKMTEGRNQISGSLLGFAIILGSYMILNTISPGLITFPELFVEPGKLGELSQNLLEDVLSDLYLKELPLGALITSEYSASTFLDDTTPTDPEVDKDNIKAYATAFPNVKAYQSDFQGALDGRRLKRIWETASSSNSMAEVMDKIAKDIKDSLSYINISMGELMILVNTGCSCTYCSTGICIPPGPSPCLPVSCNNMLDPCWPVRLEMNRIQEDIPKLYEDDKALIPCRILELEYASKAYLNFLKAQAYVDSDDAPGSSFRKDNGKDNNVVNDYNSLRNKIKDNCGDHKWTITNDNGNTTSVNVIDEIDKQIEVLANTENKGSWSPSADVAERDIATNFSDLESIYKEILNIKKIMNPYDFDFQSLDIYTYYTLERIKNDTQTFDPDQVPTSMVQKSEIIVAPYSIGFDSSVTSLVEIKKYSEDPVTFYYEDPEAYLQPSAQIERNQSLWERINNWLSLKTNIVMAEDPPPITPDTGAITAGIEEVDKTSCSPLVEIPIGDTTDEALKLIKDILDELGNIKDKGSSIPLEISIAQAEQENFFDATNDFIDLTKECKSSCLTTCACTCLPVCTCSCTGQVCPSFVELSSKKVKFDWNYQIFSAPFSEIYDGLESAIESFKKLDSQESNDNNNTNDFYLGRDTCCVNKDDPSNCRSETDPSGYTNIEKRDYTLKEQLVKVQLLLNRTREIGFTVSEKDGGKSDYEVLVEGIGKDEKRTKGLNDYPEFKKMAYGTTAMGKAKDSGATSMWDVIWNSIGLTGGIGDVAPDSLMITESRYLRDLSDCNYIYENVEQLDADQEKHDLSILLSSEVIRGGLLEDTSTTLDPDNPEICTPDPLLDCYYYTKDEQKNTPFREKSPYHCYSYTEDIAVKRNPPGTRIPEGGNLANNMYCCIVPRQPLKEL